MSWWTVFPILIVASALFIAPGALVAYFTRTRGFTVLAVAPAISVSLIAVAAVIAPWVGMRWSLGPLALITVVTVLMVYVLSRVMPQGSTRQPRLWRGQVMAEIAAMSIGAFLVGRRLIAVFGRPDAISQTFDNVFHLNAVRYIAEGGNGSSFSVGAMTGGAFYPAAWHDMVSLLAGITKSGIPTAVIGVNLFIGAVIWPLACIFLVQNIFGRRVLPTLIAGILAAGFGAFPILMMDYGVLYPFALAVSLLPISLATAVGALNLGEPSSLTKPSVNWVLLVLALPGLALAHPSAVMALLAILIPVLLGVGWRAARRALGKDVSHVRVVSVGVLIFGLSSFLFVMVWRAVRPAAEAAGWPPIQTTGRAIGEVISGSQIGQPVSVIMSVLTLTGLVLSIAQRRQLWLVGMYGVIAFLFVVVSSFPVGDLRSFLTGVWYNDSPRVAALLPIVTLPLATLGCIFLAEKAWQKSLGFADHVEQGFMHGFARMTWLRYLGLGLGVVILTFGTQQENIRAAATNASGAYRITTDSSLLSNDELALIKRLPDHVPSDKAIASNPWNGSSLAFALAGRRTLQLHLISEISADARKINQRLKEAGSDPSVCSSVRALDVGYVLDFGHREVHGADHGYYGLDGLDASGVAKLIDSEGEAKLYKIEACTP